MIASNVPLIITTACNVIASNVPLIITTACNVIASNVPLIITQIRLYVHYSEAATKNKKNALGTP